MDAASATSERIAGPQRPPRVLIVDDDAGIRLVCATALSLDGFDVIEAVNGQDALVLARTGEPDVVLLDISMPVLDGFGVAAALRADERTRHLPFVFLTGELNPDSVKRGHEAGAAGFFAKPFEPRAITEFLRSVLGRSERSAYAPAGGHAF